MTDEDKQYMQDAVERGARLLDEHRPGWHLTVSDAMTRGLFDMTNWGTCMVGTLEMYGTAEWNNDSRIAFNGYSIPISEADTHGFLPPFVPNLEYFDYLDELWREQVNQRLAEEDQ